MPYSHISIVSRANAPTPSGRARPRISSRRCAAGAGAAPPRATSSWTARYVIIPARAHHAWHTHADADAVLLARRDGPADFHFVDP